jgi:hypothetical protein
VEIKGSSADEVGRVWPNTGAVHRAADKCLGEVVSRDELECVIWLSAIVSTTVPSKKALGCQPSSYHPGIDAMPLSQHAQAFFSDVTGL